MPGLTRKAFEKFGFSTATLVTDWAQIAGADLARYTVPERLKWPRGAEGDGEPGEDRPGATLVLRVDPARALDVEYRSRQILERINAYFGYRAIQTLRIVQAPLMVEPTKATKHQIPTPALAGQTAGPEAANDPLVAALARLEQGVLRDQAPRR